MFGIFPLTRDLMLCNLQVSLVTLAEKNEGLIVPGYTHMQRAQPVLLQHLLLAYVEQVIIGFLMKLSYLLLWHALFP